MQSRPIPPTLIYKKLVPSVILMLYSSFMANTITIAVQIKSKNLVRIA